jgi:hypothetical protein
MKSTFVVQLIEQFSNKERREAARLLSSPYFNRRKTILGLFEYLDKCIHEEKRVPEKEEAFALLFPEKKFSGQQLRLLSSNLLKLLEQFLILKEMESDPTQFDHFLLAAYRKKNLNNHFQKALKGIKKEREQHALRHPDFHYSSYLLEREKEIFQLANSGRTGALDLQESENHLSFLILSMKLRQACFTIAHQTVYRTQYDQVLLEEVVQLAENYLHVPAVSLYYFAYQSISQVDNDHYFKSFKTQLLENFDCFPLNEIQDILLLAINFCIRKINENRQEYLSEALELYKKGLQSGSLLKRNSLSRFAYNNIVGIALRIGETEWATDFVNEYKPFLKSDFREVTYNLNAARLEYSQKNHTAALQHLQKADYRDFINHMTVKVLQMKIYFELDEIELLEAHLKSMHTVVKRNHRVAYHQKNYLNVIRLTRKLLRLDSMDSKKRTNFIEAINEEEPLTEKEWLLKQIG